MSSSTSAVTRCGCSGITIKLGWVLLVLSLLLFTLGAAYAGEGKHSFTLLSDRTEFHLKPVIQQFEAQTGYEVHPIYVDAGSLPARLQARPDEADLVVTTDLVTLEIAKQRGYTVPIQGSRYLPSVPAQFKDPQGHYTALSYRARTMVIKAGSDAQFRDYSDLASGKFRVCMRPLNHAYNINLVSQMIADRGESYARTWVAGVRAALSMSPTGSDRSQAGFVAADKCDVSLMNTYYFGMLHTSNSTRKVAAAVSLFFPDQAGAGTYILESGAALTHKSEPAVAFLDYLLSPLGQNFMANQTFEYPVMPGVELPDMVKAFAEGQPGVKDGIAKLNVLPLAKVAQYRDLATQILNEGQ